MDRKFLQKNNLYPHPALLIALQMCNRIAELIQNTHSEAPRPSITCSLVEIAGPRVPQEATAVEVAAIERPEAAAVPIAYWAVVLYQG